MKEQVYASRDIKRGEPLTTVVNRERDYFYFVDGTGTMLRAKQERKPALTPAERARREREAQYRREQAAQRKVLRDERKLKEYALREQRSLAREARIRAKIAELQAKI
jgi:hypothetical protein